MPNTYRDVGKMLLTFNQEAPFVHSCVSDLMHGFATLTAEMLIATRRRKQRHDPGMFKPGDQQLSGALSRIGRSFSAARKYDLHVWTHWEAAARSHEKSFFFFFKAALLKLLLFLVAVQTLNHSMFFFRGLPQVHQQEKTKYITVLLYWLPSLRSRTEWKIR